MFCSGNDTLSNCTADTNIYSNNTANYAPNMGNYPAYLVY